MTGGRHVATSLIVISDPEIKQLGYGQNIVILKQSGDGHSDLDPVLEIVLLSIQLLFVYIYIFILK